MPNIPQFLPSWGAIANVTPFTHRDNATYLTMLHDLSHYLTFTLIPTINEEFSEQRVASTGVVVDLLTQVNGLIETLNTTNTSAEDALIQVQAIQLDVQNVADSIPDLTTRISNVEAVADSALQEANADATVAGYVVAESATKAALSTSIDNALTADQPRQNAAFVAPNAVRKLEAIRPAPQNVASAADAGVTATISKVANITETALIGTTSTDNGNVTTIFRYSQGGEGAPTLIGGGGGFYSPRARSVAGGDSWGGHQTVDYMAVSADHELNLQVAQGLTTFVKVYVDDVLVIDYSEAYIADQRYKIRITPTTRRTMHVRVDTNTGVRLIRRVAGDILYAPVMPLFIRKVYAKGDSWVAGAQDPSGRSWVQYLSELTGWEILRGGYSGTGYTVTGSSGGLTFGQSVTPDIVPTDPDVVIVGGSINDAVNPTAVQAAAESMLTALANELPGTPVILVGPQFNMPGGPSNAVCDTIQTGLVNAAANATNVIGVISTKGWFAGTTTGDTIIAADGVHPTALGHTYYAARLRGELLEILSSESLPS